MTDGVMLFLLGVIIPINAVFILVPGICGWIKIFTGTVGL